MNGATPRVVYDCNVYFQALINAAGPAGLCLEAAFELRLVLFWSSEVEDEVRRTAGKASLRERFTQLTDQRVDELLENVHKVARRLNHVPEHFYYKRDPDDAHYVNLAVHAQASLIVSRDKDLLALSDLGTIDGRNFQSQYPSLRIITPPELLRELDQAGDSRRQP